MKPIRVLVVDDSVVMRGLITSLLRRDADIEVVGEASDPLEARQAINQLNPDVVTLDVEMPNMNGLEFLNRIMRLRPMPVIMISNLTQRGAQASIQALEAGAVDCIAKPTSGNLGELERLASKVRMAAKAQIRREPQKEPAKEIRTDESYRPSRRIVAIGSSTGGVEALSSILRHFPANCPPTVVAQHMPETFLGNLTARFNNLYAPTIALAVDGAPLLPGHVYFAPGGRKHLEVVEGSPKRCAIREGDPINGYCPSVDLLFKSTSRVGADALGVILTGMGRDGADGLLAMRRAGASTIGQDEASSLIYGMPRVAFEIGAVERQVPLANIGAQILSLTKIKQEGNS